MTAFASIELAPPDPILGLSEAFTNDPNPDKINLGVGVYKDAHGKTPILRSVKAAEQLLIERETTKGYLPIPGDATYGRKVQELLFGPEHPLLNSGRVFTAHTPAGTGALRVAGDFLHKLLPGKTIWFTQPTWPNHPAVFTASNVPQQSFPWFDAASNSLDFEAAMDALRQIPNGDIVLLHASCHNPTGIDPAADQWREIAAVLAERALLPLIDCAYQGLGDGIEEDAVGLRTVLAHCPEAIICTSYSKNFSLYRERVGSLSFVSADADTSSRVASQVKTVIRANYSNPPAHGAAIVQAILQEPELYAEWMEELKAMRDRINGMRALFVKTFKSEGVKRDFSFINEQRGMFSFSGLNKDQVAELREKRSIYIVGSGRINVAGMTEDNMPRLCQAIASVL